MGWDDPPSSASNVCGAPVDSQDHHLIGELCRRSIDGRRCGGMFQTTFRTDWGRVTVGKGEDLPAAIAAAPSAEAAAGRFVNRSGKHDRAPHEPSYGEASHS